MASLELTGGLGFLEIQSREQGLVRPASGVLLSHLLRRVDFRWSVLCIRDLWTVTRVRCATCGGAREGGRGAGGGGRTRHRQDLEGRRSSRAQLAGYPAQAHDEAEVLLCRLELITSAACGPERFRWLHGAEPLCEHGECALLHLGLLMHLTLGGDARAAALKLWRVD